MRKSDQMHPRFVGVCLPDGRIIDVKDMSPEEKAHHAQVINDKAMAAIGRYREGNVPAGLKTVKLS